MRPARGRRAKAGCRISSSLLQLGHPVRRPRQEGKVTSHADLRHTPPGRCIIRTMDNLSHTLVGAALGRAVAHGRVRQAALIGAVAANAPDWTGFLIGFRGRRIDYYSMHRGITHSLLGAAGEIPALTLVGGLGSLWGARRLSTLPPRPRPPG